MVKYGDINDPNRIWDIPEDWEKLPLNREWWDHQEVMTCRGRMIVITQAKQPNTHPPFQFATSVHKTWVGLNFENSEHVLTVSDVRRWDVEIDGFSEDEITSAMEFIQTG